MKKNIKKRKKWLKTQQTTPNIKPDEIDGETLVLTESTVEDNCVVFSEATDVYDDTIYLNNGEAIERQWSASVTKFGTNQYTVTKTNNFPHEENLYEEVIIGGNHFIKFETCYRKTTYKGNLSTAINGFEIANYKKDPDFVPYDCFVDEEGNVLPYILIGKYAISSNDIGNSIPLHDVTPVRKTVAQFRTICKAVGKGYQLLDMAILSFWRDLGFVSFGTLAVNVEPQSSITKIQQLLGVKIYKQPSGYLTEFAVDGIVLYGNTGNNYIWIYSNKPSKYSNSIDWAYVVLHYDNDTGYQKLKDYDLLAVGTIETDRTYYRPIDNLGYDKAYPNINLPQYINNTHHNSFNFYSGFRISTTTDHIVKTISVAFYDGLYSTEANQENRNCYGYLCYRPIK